MVLAGATAGRAVVFAGSTVVVSIFGLVLMGRDYLWGVALATSLAVTVVVIASVTLLPAMLGFAGRSIDRFRLPWFRHDVEGRRTLSWRWSRIMQRRPLLAGLAALVVLLALAAPALDMRFGMPDAGNGPEELTSRQAYDLIERGLRPGRQRAVPGGGRPGRAPRPEAPPPTRWTGLRPTWPPPTAWPPSCRPC